MSIVRFNDWGEFEAEIQTAEPKDNTARVTLSIRYDAASVSFLTLVSGFQTKTGDIVECVEYLGRAPEPKSDQALATQRKLEERKHALTALGYLVKAGRYHVAPGAGR